MSHPDLKSPGLAQGIGFGGQKVLGVMREFKNGEREEFNRSKFMYEKQNEGKDAPSMAGWADSRSSA
jgi:hypothetical protein